MGSRYGLQVTSYVEGIACCVLRILEEACRAIGDQQNQREHYQNQSNRPREAGSEDFPSMLAVEFGACRHFGLVLGFDPLLFVPPRAAAVEVVPDV